MEMGMTSLLGLARLGRGVRSRRWSSYDTRGGNNDKWFIEPGQTRVLGEMEGSGCVRHIWMTMPEADFTLRRMVLRTYWDGEETPSVAAPLGDFFGLGHARPAYFNSLPLQASYLGMNCWFPMPYAKGARLTVTNDSDKPCVLYFYIDYQEWDEPPANAGRFHCNWRRELVRKAPQQLEDYGDEIFKMHPVNRTGEHNYLVLEAEGKGHYAGCCLHLDTNEPGWWGEGDDMFFVDGENWPPRLHGTGMEDYFCGAWNYNHLERTYSNPYYGYHYKGNPDYTGKHSQYRFHVEDPIYFEKSLRFSIEHGHANDRQGDWTSTAYWYQIGRMKPLPEIPPFEARIPYQHGGIERGWGKDRRELPV